MMGLPKPPDDFTAAPPPAHTRMFSRRGDREGNVIPVIGLYNNMFEFPNNSRLILINIEIHAAAAVRRRYDLPETNIK